MQCFEYNVIQVYQLAAINQCRLFLRVIFLLDISTGDGLYIYRSTYNGKPNHWLSKIYEWPKQEGKPGKTNWYKWKRAIESTFDVSMLTLQLPLPYQLREWDEDIPPMKWQW